MHNSKKQRSSFSTHHISRDMMRRIEINQLRVHGIAGASGRFGGASAPLRPLRQPFPIRA